MSLVLTSWDMLHDESKLFCNWKNPKSKNYVDLWILEQFYNTHVILIKVIDHNGVENMDR